MHTLLIAVYHPLHKHLRRKRWKKETSFKCSFCKLWHNSVESFKRHPSSLSRAVFHHREHITSLIFPQIPISVTSWWYVGWCWPPFVFRSLVAYSSAIYTVEMKQGHQWETATCWEQVFTCCSTPPPSHPSALSWSFLLCNPTTGRCSCYNWASRSTSSAPHDVRDAWLPNIEMDQKCPYVSMACISRKHCLASH